MTYKPPKREKDGKSTASQEERLLGLLSQAEHDAYVLAHSYDIGGQRDRAWEFVALGERLHETAMGTSVLTRPDEPHSSGAAPALGSQGPSMAPLVPRLLAEQPSQESQERLGSSTSPIGTYDP
jgi:hypothetical protein